MTEFSADPIHPGGSPSPELPEFIASWRALRPRSKVLLGVYAVLGGAGSAYASYVLVHEVHHWGAWAFALLVLEPIALAAFVFIGVLFAPDSALATMLSSARKRATAVAIAVGVGFASLILGLFGFIAWELWKVR